MKHTTTTFIIFFTIFFSHAALAQNLMIFGKDGSHFPGIKAKAFVFKSDGTPKDSLAPDDFKVKDDLKLCTVDVSTLPSLPAPAATVVIALDATGSAEKTTTGLEVAGAQLFCKELRNTESTIAITYFDDRSSIVYDFSTDRTALASSLHSLQFRKSTDYTRALTESKTGAFRLFNVKDTRKKIILLFTDGNSPTDATELINKAKTVGASVYCIVTEHPANSTIKEVAAQTQGEVFENINTQSDMESAVRSVIALAEGHQPYVISWNSVTPCNEHHVFQIKAPEYSATSSFTYTVPDSLRAMMRLSAAHLNFGKVIPNTTAQTSISISAIKTSVVIDSAVVNGSPFFTIDKKLFPMRIEPNESKQLLVTYASKDSSFTWAKVRLYCSTCHDEEFTVTAGYPGVKPLVTSIKILYPINGDTVFSNNDISVKWEGVAPENRCWIELSTDGGNQWTTVTQNAVGNSYNWKVPVINSIRCKLRVHQMSSDGTERELQMGTGYGNFTIKTPTIAVRDVNIQATPVGETKDTVIRSYFGLPKDNEPQKIYSMRIEGKHADEFTIMSGLPPQDLPPESGLSVEFGFSPKQEGVREANIIIHTSQGYFMKQIYGYGYIPELTSKEEIIDFGDIVVGDSSSRFISDALRNRTTNKTFTITDMKNIGPDTTQFSLPDGFERFNLKPLSSFPLSITFKPTKEGRVSSRFNFISTEPNSPHVIHVLGNGIDESQRRYPDPTAFRGIAVPTALIPARGTVTVGNYDGVGLTAGYAVSENFMLIAGGAIPVPINKQTSSALSLGFKLGYTIIEDLNFAVGYQYANSSYDKSETPETESNIIQHIPYGVLTFGNDNQKISAAFGYTAKHHVTITKPEGFNANAKLVVVSGDYRIAPRWKICAEVYSFETLGSIPIAATARYIGKTYALDIGLGYLGIKTDGTEAPSFPVFPVLSAVWAW